MSDLIPSYGTSLPDSEILVDNRSKALIELLPTIASFVSFRAGLEREYGKKVVEASTKARAQALKEGPERGGGTLQKAYLEIISSTEWEGRHSARIADSLQKEVSDALISAATKLEGVRKKQHQFSSKLTSERDRTVHEYEKSKQRYFDACDTLESARQKRTLAKDERSTEKATRSFDLAQVDMLVAKNQFLLDVDIANITKLNLYRNHLPALHDDYQLLEAATVRTLVDLLGKFSSIGGDTFERRHEAVQMADVATKAIDIIADQKSFIDSYSPAKLEAWALPRDLQFEECPVWHDSGEMSITPSSINFLQNVKIKASTRLATITPTIESKKREISGLRNLREAYEKDRSLGDSNSVLENLMESIRDTTTLEIEQTQLKAQIDLINSTLPDDEPSSLKLHDLKSTSFVTPTTCAVCEGTVWGKGLTCKQCGVCLHSKCELKIPAGCGAKGAGGGGASLSRNRSGSVKSHNSRSSIDTSTSSGVVEVGNTRSLPPPISPISTISGVRKIPPAFGLSSIAPISPITVVEVQRNATVLYDYEATTAFELTVQEGDIVVVVEDEDESGWSKILMNDGRRGLVPGSYLQIQEEELAEDYQEDEEVGEVEVVQGVKQVLALYDYVAQTEEELNCTEGEYLELTNTTEVFEGWVEVIKDGKIGLVPSSYVEVV